VVVFADYVVLFGELFAAAAVVCDVVGAHFEDKLDCE
jgi:hypothetical protein